jgi:hypothetical protein
LRTVVAALVVLIAELPSDVAAVEPDAAKPLASSPLAGLPAPAGAHIARIEALADNAWLNLGAPAADPRWGRARGRSWTAKMALAPELRGAFLIGEGVHGYAGPDGRYMDDLWFYDIPGHRWICCYPGADTATLELTIDADGFEVDASGRRVAVAQLAHGYEMSAYDTDRRLFYCMPNTHSYWETALPQRKAWLVDPPSDVSPWSWDPATADWGRRRTGGEAPPSSYGDNLLYVPSRRQLFFAHRSSEVWFYDPDANRWTHAEPSGPPPPFGIDGTCCLDPVRDRIYLGGGAYPVAPEGTNAFWIYDLVQDAWVDPRPQGAPCRGSTGYATLNALMLYDTANDVVLLVRHSNYYEETRDHVGVYVYDPRANAWSDAGPVPDALAFDHRVKNGFYDQELNAVFIHTAGDSEDDGLIWVYRYRHAPTP